MPVHLLYYTTPWDSTDSGNSGYLLSIFSSAHVYALMVVGDANREGLEAMNVPIALDVFISSVLPN